MSDVGYGFEFEVCNYDAQQHEIDDLSTIKLKFESLRYDPDAKTLKVLDQLLLPLQTVYIPVENVRDAHRVIQDMNVRGAPLIATVALLGLNVDLEHNPEAKKESLKDYIKNAVEYLKTARPTAINLSNEVLRLNEFVAELPFNLSFNELKMKVQGYAYNFFLAERHQNNLLLRNSIVCVEHNVRPEDRNQPLRIMTICNTGALATSSFGTALGVIRALHLRRRLDVVYCLETRPYNQGARLTATELEAEGIPHRLIVDSAAAAALKLQHFHAIIVGADQVALNGDTANKIGTYMLSVLAKHHGVPFYVVTPTSSINPRIQCGDQIIIEERKPEELKIFNGIPIAPPNTQVWNPAFDITDHFLISAILTEKGNSTPEKLAELLRA